jgi:hypothetical protein
VREIAEILAGARSYDDVDPKTQAMIRREWEARIEARRASLNLSERFAAEGRTWVEADPDRGPVRRGTAGDGSPGRRRRRPAATQRAAAAKPTTAKAPIKAKAKTKTKGRVASR